MMRIALLLLAVSGLVPALCAEDYVHQSFSFTVPPRFTSSPVPGDAKGIICAYRRKEGGTEVWLFVERYPGKVPERLEDPKLVFVAQPDVKQGKRWIADWNGTKIGVAEGTIKDTTLDHRGQEMNTYEFIISAYLPTRPNPIKVSIIGSANEEGPMREMMIATLASLKTPQVETPGATQPDSQASPEDSGMMVVIAVIALGVLLAMGAGIMVLRKRRAPPVAASYSPPPSPPDQRTGDRAPWE